MRITVIGSGNVGGTLGAGWVAAGHEVVFTGRDPDGDRVQAAVGTAGTGASAAPLPRALDGADVVVLAVPWAAAEETVRGIADLLDGTVLVDATNPIGPGPALVVGGDSSGAETVARWAPGARVVKAFNSTGFENMADPAYPDGPAAMFVAADDDEARAVVLGLAADLGFDAVDAGPLAAARWLEPLCLLWIGLTRSTGAGRTIAFRLARR